MVRAWFCQYCDYVTDSLEDLREHKSSHTQEEKIQFYKDALEKELE